MSGAEAPAELSGPDVLTWTSARCGSWRAASKRVTASSCPVRPDLRRGKGRLVVVGDLFVLKRGEGRGFEFA